MRRFILSALILASSTLVSACEGECITGVTNVWLGNYTTPIHAVFRALSTEIANRLIPEHARPENPFDYVEPLLDFYALDAYAGMEHAIFPSFFHGKCQRPDGTLPPGCPNPDCATVCGTPGSLVHFYPKLRFIAHNRTRNALAALVAPGSDAYAAVEELVLADALESKPRMARRFLRAGPPDTRPAIVKRAERELAHARTLKRRTQEVKTQLRTILAQAMPMMEQACGGTGHGQTNGLPGCSWEREMKEYILTFP